MSDLDTPGENHLLDALPEDVYERMLPNLERVQMPLGRVIYESREALRYVYFPTDCTASSSPSY